MITVTFPLWITWFVVGLLCVAAVCEMLGLLLRWMDHKIKTPGRPK